MPSNHNSLHLVKVWWRWHLFEVKPTCFPLDNLTLVARVNIILHGFQKVLGLNHSFAFLTWNWSNQLIKTSLMMRHHYKLLFLCIHVFWVKGKKNLSLSSLLFIIKSCGSSVVRALDLKQEGSRFEFGKKGFIHVIWIFVHKTIRDRLQVALKRCCE